MSPQKSAAQTYQAEPTPAVGADWQWRGKCRDVDPDLFVTPDRGSRATAALTRRAKAFCETCPVWRPCLRAALLGGDPGVWGGLAAAERELLLAAARGDVDHALDLEALRRPGPTA